jgi:hypothetical protein
MLDVNLLTRKFLNSLKIDFLFFIFRYSPPIIKLGLFAFLDSSGQQAQTANFGILSAKLFLLSGLCNLGLTSFVQSKNDYQDNKYMYSGNLIFFLLSNLSLLFFLSYILGTKFSILWLLVVASELIFGEAYAFVLYFKNVQVASLVYFFKNVFISFIFFYFYEFEISIIISNIILLLFCIYLGYRISLTFNSIIIMDYYRSVKYTIYGFLFSKSFEYFIRRIFISETRAQNLLNYITILNNLFYSLYDNFIINKNYKLILSKQYRLDFIDVLFRYSFMIPLYSTLFIFTTYFLNDWNAFFFSLTIFIQVGAHIYLSNCILYRQIPLLFLFSIAITFLLFPFIFVNVYYTYLFLNVTLLLTIIILNRRFEHSI